MLDSSNLLANAELYYLLFIINYFSMHAHDKMKCFTVINAVAFSWHVVLEYLRLQRCPLKAKQSL